MDKNLRAILQQLEAEKNIDRDTLIEAIRSAIESAARKNMPEVAEIMVDVDPEKLEFKVYEVREVAEEITDPAVHITLTDAQALNPNAKVGNRLKVEAAPQDFGRIAAQTAKQVIIQKIKDAERDNIYDEFKKREGELVTGTVKRHSQGNLIVMVDKAEAIIPPREQAVRESFRPNDRIRAILLSVEKSTRGAQIILSRSTPDLVRSLFEMEVPEIFDDTIEIKAIAREAGSRTKVAVQSNDPNVDAVGACVGMKGSRVRTVVEELSGEKIDIVRWSEDPVELCGHALNPADILDITLDEEAKTVSVTVPHDQLSLAIGKKGQNARLASRLIGWNIDIISDGVVPAPLTEPMATEPVATESEATEPEATESEATETEATETEATETEATETEATETETAEAKATETETAEAVAESPETPEPVEVSSPADDTATTE